MYWHRASAKGESDERRLVADRAERPKDSSGRKEAPEEAAMTLHQKFGRPGYEFHPELGYLCPSRQLRQNVRVGLAAALFGIITGLGAALVLLPRHSDNIAWTEPALAAAPAESASHSVSGSGPSSLAVTSDTAKRVP